VFCNSSGEMASISFADFRGPEKQFAPDLALLVSLVADVADAADRAGAELARHCTGCRRTARPVQGIYKSQFCCGSTRRRAFAASTVSFSEAGGRGISSESNLWSARENGAGATSFIALLHVGPAFAGGALRQHLAAQVVVQAPMHRSSFG
jgi:hypothetical protein